MVKPPKAPTLSKDMLLQPAPPPPAPVAVPVAQEARVKKSAAEYGSPINVRIPDALAHRTRIFAATAKIKLNELVEQALKDYIDQRAS